LHKYLGRHSRCCPRV